MQGRRSLTTMSEHAPDESANITQDELALLFPELEIIRLIGRGGMGVVYQARQRSLDRMVALKVLPGSRAGDPQYSERFRREASVLANLKNPKIVALYDYGERGDFLYFLMEYVDGIDLAQRLKEGSLTTDEARRIVPQICEALEYSHAQGIIHRDIKPANILIDRSGDTKIADFGLAKFARPDGYESGLTLTNMALGTPRYMAPEQMENLSTLDHRVDIYALGVVLYEMLTGEPPAGSFALPSERRPGVDARMDEVILRAMDPAPGHRQSSASEVKTDFIGALRPRGAFTLTKRQQSWLVRAVPVSLAALTISVGLVYLANEDTRWGRRGEPSGQGRLQQVLPSGTVVRLAPGGAEDDRGVPSVLQGEKVASISVSGSEEEFGVAVLADGTIRGWGSNAYGQATPPPDLHGVVAVAAGNGDKAAHCVALHADGSVSAWGDDTHGQARVPRGLDRAVQIAAGQFHSVVLRDDGTVVAWGYELDGVIAVPTDLPRIKAIAAGAWFTVALTVNGDLRVWGTSRARGCEVPSAIRDLRIAKVAAGSEHIAAITEHNELLLWGQDRSFRRKTLSGESIRSLAATGHLTTAVDSANRLYVLGRESPFEEITSKPVIGLGIQSTGILAIVRPE